MTADQFSDVDPFATTETPAPPPEASFDGHDDGEPLTEAQLDDLIAGENVGGAIVRAGEDLLLASPDRLREVARAVASGLSSRLNVIARQAAEHRGTVGRPTASHLTHEFHALSRAHEVLAELERTFGGLKRQAAGHAADAVEDHLGRKRAAVSTPDGGEVVVETKAPTSKVSVVEADLLDIVATATLVRSGLSTSVTDDPGGVRVMTYASGVRAGIEALRALGTPSWKSTALEGLVADLQRRGEPELAARLEQSFGRVAAGEPKTTLTVKYPDPTDA